MIVIPVTPLELVGIVCGGIVATGLSFLLLTLLATALDDSEWSGAVWAARWPAAAVWGGLATYGLAQLA